MDVCELAKKWERILAVSTSRPAARARRADDGARFLMAKSRHREAENVRCCFKLFPDAIADLTGLPAPGDSRR